MAKRSRDDVDNTNVLPDRTRPPAHRPQSEKQKANDENAKQREIEQLQKELRKLKKANLKHSTQSRREDPEGDELSSPESEEEEEHPVTSFPTSIKSLGTFVSTPARKLRPDGASQRRALHPLSNNDLFSAPVTDHGHQRRQSDHSTSPIARGRPFSRSMSSSPRRRSPLSPANFSPIGKRVASRSVSPAQPRKHLKVAQWRNGVTPTGRAKARDYEDSVYHVIIKACHDYEARVGGMYSWPELDQQFAWAQEAWEKACAVVKEEYEVTDRILSLIRQRGSRARGELINGIRPKIATTYGFVHSDNAATIRRNKKLAANLLEGNAFHYKDVKNQSGFAQHKIISDVLHEVWFDRKTAIGVEFSDYFKPISLTTMSSIFTGLEFCIAEWSTGQFVKAVFNEKAGEDNFKAHLKDLTEWNKGNTLVIGKIRNKLFERALRSAGALSLEATSRVSNDAKLRAQQELEGRTGDTDSEEEEHSEGEGDCSE